MNMARIKFYGKPELQILVSFCNPEKALETYKERWQIETAFYDKHIIMQSNPSVSSATV
jgi:transposase